LAWKRFADLFSPEPTKRGRGRPPTPCRQLVNVLLYGFMTGGMFTYDRRIIMRHLQGAKIMRAGLLATLLLTAVGVMVVAHAGKTTPALSADHVIACIRTAVTAQAGLVKEVEVEYEGQQWLCEVKLVDEAGKRYKLHVDVATNRMVKAK
jgi:acyl-coenzyme A thioesterase PaaI-like protein